MVQVTLRITAASGRAHELIQAVAKFSMAYADQNERDHDALARAVRQGKVETEFEENP